VAMIGMHATKDRPVVVDGQIVIRPIMIVALTYDHRLLDGREAVTFLGEWDLSVVLVLYAEQPADGIVLVVVGTYSEGEGVYRGPSQDAIGITKLALHSFCRCFVVATITTGRVVQEGVFRACPSRWLIVGLGSLKPRFVLRSTSASMNILRIMVSFSFIILRHNGE